MGFFAVLIIAFIVLIIIRANSTKINSFTVLLCIVIFGSTLKIVLEWKLNEAFIVIVPFVIVVLAFWIGKKLSNEKNMD